MEKLKKLLCISFTALFFISFSLCITYWNHKQTFKIRQALDAQMVIEFERNPKNEKYKYKTIIKEGIKLERPKIQNHFDYIGYMDCLLEIPAIELKQVIISGGNPSYNLSKHLLVAAQETMEYGDGKPYVICGHQSYQYGYSFNRLEELIPGDSIYITKNGITDTYIVTETKIQYGTTDSDFQTENQITLMTCVKQTQTPKPYIVVRGIKKN